MSRRENGSWIFEIFIQNNSQTGRESKQIGGAAEAIGAEEISEVDLQAVPGCRFSSRDTRLAAYPASGQPTILPRPSVQAAGRSQPT
jgi:hypothetical protein